MSNEETKEAKKELDEIDKKFDEARGVKFKVNYRVVRFYDHGDLSSKNSLTMQICPMKKLLQMMKQVKMMKLPPLKLWSMRNKVSLSTPRKSPCLNFHFFYIED